MAKVTVSAGGPAATLTGLSPVTAPQPAGIVVSGGAGSTPGAAGTVSVDGRIVTDSWTH